MQVTTWLLSKTWSCRDPLKLCSLSDLNQSQFWNDFSVMPIYLVIVIPSV